MKKIRILFVVNGFSVGGGELKLLELIREITTHASDRFECIVCSVGIAGPLKAEFEKLGVRIELFLKSGPYDVTQIVRVARLIREARIDIVQTTLFYADVIGTYAARLCGVHRIISWEAVTQPYALKHLWAYRLASKWFARSVAVSRAIQKQVVLDRHVPGTKTCTIRYGVDLGKFTVRRDQALRRELGLSSKAVLIGTVARLTPQKGHEWLIRAVPEIAGAFPECHFVFIGDGPLHLRLEKQAAGLNVADRVHFLGFRDNVNVLLNNLDLFVLPSLYEGLPNVVLEAMACGLPVVATAVDGTPEAVIHEQTGLLVPPCEPDPLARAVISLLGNRGRMQRMGHAGRKRVEQVFSLEGQVGQFIHLYESLLCQGG
ncbi:glycosyltransferase [bacterium]|nr:glycosyltransferase [bacterium]